MTSDLPPDLERYRSYLWLLAECDLSPRLRVKEDASDIVQQSLMKAYRDLARYRGRTEAELKGWLRTILAHTLLNTARHYGAQQRDMRKEQQIAASLHQSSMQIEKLVASEETSPSQQASHNEQFQQLAAGLAQLLEGERTAIMLKHFQDWPLSQISEHMGRPPDSVAGLLKRGLKKLRAHLQSDTE